MKEAQRQTRSYLMKLFERHGFHPRHDLGQNFLIDLNIIEYVVDQAELGLDDVVLEIGAGTGGMTAFLVREAAHVVSVELDRNMYALAREATAGAENLTLLNTDALRNKNHFADAVLDAVQQQLDVSRIRRLKLVANLPYSVATPVISNLVATDLPWSLMVVTIQYELGLRMRAQPRDSHFGSLAAWLQAQCRVRMLKKLPPTVFWPRPQVDSAIMRIEPAADLREKIGDRDFYHDFIRRVFQQRRKLLRSALVGMYRKELGKEGIDAVLAESGLGESVRAEELEVPQLVELSRRFQAAIAE
jgi:16S rRNA (adenine1518-N6/adenine1519-N6)-dimethyltransferase